jgi:hypothetical protein
MTLQFDEETHTYSVDGVVYTSVSQLIGEQFVKFDADKIIDKMMKSKKWPNSKYHGMSKEEIQTEWREKSKEASTAGSKLHEHIDMYLNDQMVDDDSVEYQHFLQFRNDHPELQFAASEMMVYDTETRMAGTLDALFLDESTDSFVIVDWKRCKPLEVDKIWDYSTNPDLKHVPDTKLSRYSLQLNLYKYLLQKTESDMIVESLRLVRLHPDEPIYEIHNIPMMNGAVETLMSERRARFNQGQVRVGRRIYQGGKYHEPYFPGFTSIIVMTKCSAFGSLSPFELCDERGRNLENIWQASKVYPNVPQTKQCYSRYDKRVIWERKAETHAIKRDDVSWQILPAYLKWRRDLMNCKYAVRYPVGFNHRHNCLFALAEGDDGEIVKRPLDYVSSRKAIYVPLYERLVQDKKQFLELRRRLAQGENLLIIEVDGPHQESMTYYQEHYHTADDFMTDDTMLATADNLKIMLNDPKHPYGHGFCLAAALQDINLC